MMPFTCVSMVYFTMPLPNLMIFIYLFIWPITAFIRQSQQNYAGYVVNDSGGMRCSKEKVSLHNPLQSVNFSYQ